MFPCRGHDADAMQSVLPMQVVWCNRGIEGITAILEYMDARRHGNLAPCDGAPAAIDEIPTACPDLRTPTSTELRNRVSDGGDEGLHVNRLLQ